ncbi:hypothetical protein D5086_014803 [Populus alba]|uniref:Uncharacterized protein n=1 Tax=Populus alba TaxID=43335 RepID=A0ACC4BZ57_POPAL
MEWVRGGCLGYGSSSTVHLATTKKSSSSSYPAVMAVKSCNQSDTTLLKNEREIFNEIGFCPEIIQCFGDCQTVEEDNEHLYNLLLEYAKGGSLAYQLKKSGGCLQESDVKDYTRSILKGLRHIHSKGFVHCDMKLDNMLLFENGEVKIADFGLAKKAGEKQGRVEIRGTPLYMAPESVNNNEYESGVDIWALGCAIVEMVTGKPAWNKWVSIQSFSPISEVWSDGKLESIFPSLHSSCLASPPDRIRQLTGDRSCNWCDSGCWITIR